MKDNHTPWKWGKEVLSTRHISGQPCPPRMVSNARILWNEETGEIAVESLFEPSRVHQRLLSATLNSYHKNCGDRAVECAEGDLLGECLEALRLLLICSEALSCSDCEINCSTDDDDKDNPQAKAKAILAKAKECG